MAKRKISSALSWIIREAKKLKREFPRRYSKWTDYVKQASAIYSSKHRGSSPVGHKHSVSKRKSVKRHRKIGIAEAAKGIVVVPRKVGGVKPARIAGIGAVSAGTLRSELKRRINADIDKAVVRKFHATGKRIKRKIQKSITEKKAQLRRLV